VAAKREALAGVAAAASEDRRSEEEVERVHAEVVQVCLAVQTASSAPAAAGLADAQWEVAARGMGPVLAQHKDLAAVAVDLCRRSFPSRWVPALGPVQDHLAVEVVAE
jgi:hypothetical protein